MPALALGASLSYEVLQSVTGILEPFDTNNGIKDKLNPIN